MKKMFVQLQNNKNLRLTLFFFSFMLVQLVILRLGNRAGWGYLSENLQELVYCFLQAAVIAGYLLHALLFKKLRKGKAYKTAVFVLCALCFVFSEVMLFSPEGSAFYLAVTAVCILILGCILGAVYYRMSVWITSAGRPGLDLGLGYAAAIALQYALQLQWNVKPALAALLAGAFSLLALSFFIKEDRVEPAAQPKDKAVPGAGTAFASAAIITVAMIIFTNYYNTYIHHQQIISGYTEYNVYSWPRLIMVPGIILFGRISDMKNKKLLPITALCISVTALMNVLLTGKETNLPSMCLYYLALTAAVAYYHMTFLRLASDSRTPSLCAGAGRILDSVVVSVSILIGFSDLPPAAVLAVDISALVIMIILMAIGGDFNLSAAANKKNADEPKRDPLPALQARFGISPSEMKVLRELVTTDDKQEAIAERLQISVSTLRHHVTSIYKKTGVQTRTALCKLTADHAER